MINKNVRLLFLCDTYHYAGTVVHIHDKCIELEDAYLVLDTGPMTSPHWNEAEYLGTWILNFDKVESWGPCEKTVKPNETNKPTT